MQTGDVVAGRFELKHFAGSGGMGTVFRARDLRTGEQVALKVLTASDCDEGPRLLREAKLLASLSHPGIVRYVDHGLVPDGPLYLAMDWLEGETLRARLLRQELTFDEALILARHVAAALGYSHSHGIVHRDVKPSNLFLVGGSPDAVKLLDFGIARIGAVPTTLTGTGTLVGTPGYMAPEQARGDRRVDARADVFSLGCVLYRCLAGKPPFGGAHAVAVLAKVLFDEAPPLSSTCPEAAGSLESLVERMLAKDPGSRPANCAAVATELEGIAVPPRSSRAPLASITEGERRLVSVVVALLSRPALDQVSTRGDRPGAPPKDDSVRTRAQTSVAAFGARLEWLADGTAVATVSEVGDATHQAARAARAALALREALPHADIALTIGRTLPGSVRPAVGEAIDAAVRLVADRSRFASESGAAQTAVMVDEVTAGLLRSDFALSRLGGGPVLLGERETHEPVRTLLGRQTPFVGREREMAALMAAFDESVGEPIARAVLVTGPAGVGKSRLRYEFLQRIRERGGGAQIWLERGDPMSQGSPFGLIAGMIRREARLLDGESAALRREKLRARVSTSVPDSELERVAAFLGELAGTPFPDEHDVQLRAARADKLLMGDQMRRAWENWVEAECAERPLVLVLDDLQWGDVATLRLIDAALRRLRDRPLMVLGIGRQEVDTEVSMQWGAHALTRISLDGLPRRAALQLVREMFGEEVTPEVFDRIVARAGGNALYLEELIRAFAEGRGERLPETVLAMVQARLESMEGPARRVLRAASVFGQAAWLGGIRALVGGDDELDIRTWLRDLVDREVIAQRPRARFVGEEEYVFRHEVVREAAYAMLTAQDRRTGHRLAADWLESVGDGDAAVLGQHLETGGEMQRAAACYTRAAEQALEGGDFAAAVGRSERGVACGAQGEVLGHLHLCRSRAHGWRGENGEAAHWAEQALPCFETGGEPWYRAAAELTYAAGRVSDQARVTTLGEDLLALGAATDNASDAALVAGSRLAIQALNLGLRELSERAFRWLEQHVGDTTDPATAAWIARSLGGRALVFGDPSGHMDLVRRAQGLCLEAGDLRNAALQRVNLGYAYLELGSYEAAEHELRAALSDAERMGLDQVTVLAVHNLGLALGRRGGLDEGIRMERVAAERFRAQDNRRLEVSARLYLAEMLLAAGDRKAAEGEARAAVDVAGALPIGAYALAMRARLALETGRASEALADARAAHGRLDAVGAIDDGDSLVRLVIAEALDANAEPDAAREAVSAAWRHLRERAARIRDADLRRSFLEAVPDNVRTAALAARLLGESAASSIIPQ